MPTPSDSQPAKSAIRVQTGISVISDQPVMRDIGPKSANVIKLRAPVLQRPIVERIKAFHFEADSTGKRML